MYVCDLRASVLLAPDSPRSHSPHTLQGYILPAEHTIAHRHGRLTPNGAFLPPTWPTKLRAVETPRHSVKADWLVCARTSHPVRSPGGHGTLWKVSATTRWSATPLPPSAPSLWNHIPRKRGQEKPRKRRPKSRRGGEVRTKITRGRGGLVARAPMKVTPTGRKKDAITRSPAALGLRRRGSQAQRGPKSTTAMPLSHIRTARLYLEATEAQLQIMPTTIVPLVQNIMHTVPPPLVLTRGTAGRGNQRMTTSPPQAHRTLTPTAEEALITASMAGDLHTLDEAPPLVVATRTLILHLLAIARPPLIIPSAVLRTVVALPHPATPDTPPSLLIRSDIEDHLLLLLDEEGAPSDEEDECTLHPE